MQALLSFEQAPPLSAPLRFFLTAPLFAVLAGLLLLWSGPELFASRWTPAALALTHLISAGFMLQVMIGALFQILPVVAGANLARPRLVARLVHATTVLGTLLLVAGFLGRPPLAFELAVFFLAGGLALFVGAAGRALYGVPSTSPTIRGLKLALVGLAVTVLIGALLAATIGGWLALPVAKMTSVHLSWGFIGWGVVLLAAVALVVVPMFQMTPPYPPWFTRHFCLTTPVVLSVWSIAEMADYQASSAWLSGAVVLVAVAFAGATLSLQRRSKRARFDATQRLWCVAMLCTLTACLLWLLAAVLPDLAEWPRWPLLFGVLVLSGGFMSVMIGMLYKIVPFLIWLHLQNLGGGRVMAPNMNKVIAGRQIDRQTLAHFASLALLLAASAWPEWFTYPAGIALLMANAWLLLNLLAAVAFYRQQRSKIEALRPAMASG